MTPKHLVAAVDQAVRKGWNLWVEIHGNSKVELCRTFSRRGQISRQCFRVSDVERLKAFCRSNGIEVDDLSPNDRIDPWAVALSDACRS